MAASDLESKAKEAFVDDDFELAAELYTQAIDAGPATADLYADRAQAHIKLGNYTGEAALVPYPACPRPPAAARPRVRFDRGYMWCHVRFGSARARVSDVVAMG
jgi:hypothetical protein